MWVDVNTAVELYVNLIPLMSDTDFKTRDEGIAYNESGMELVWNFETTAGVISQTVVTPTTGGGDYDWAHIGKGMYKIGCPAGSGVSINNDAEGFGFFSGKADAILDFESPVYGFRLAALNDSLIDSGGALALEATLTAMKGAGWSAETLKAIKDAIDVIDASVVAEKYPWGK